MPGMVCVRLEVEIFLISVNVCLYSIMSLYKIAASIVAISLRGFAMLYVDIFVTNLWRKELRQTVSSF